MLRAAAELAQPADTAQDPEAITNPEFPNKKADLAFASSASFYGGPGGARTPGLQIRSLTL